MHRINSQVVVEYQGRTGVTQADLPGMICGSADQTPVLFAGTTYLEPVSSGELVVVGPLDPDRYW